MKNKSIISITLIATLTFGTVSSLLLPTESAAVSNVTNITKASKSESTSTYKTASIKSFKLIRTNKTIKIYEKASTKSNVMDSIKNDQGVVVLKNYNNGWSKVSLQFDTGYIQSKYLYSAKANTKNHYAMNTKKTYSYYSPENNGSGFKSYSKATFKKLYSANKTLTNFWYFNSEPDANGRMEYETSKGLYSGYKDIGIASLAIKYPVKLNSSWKGLDGQTLKIVDTNKMVKTKAGTFNNVVVVKEGNGKNYSYYAPKVGLIKQTYNGKTLNELSAIH
ncbi:SH3 domain-containing protein [Rummeliibacillus sp. NPDC094406]|uniref:SH3 domain-containing protein n=1 Tax=Rummeliibacillus sp. NPDC094406 TaxID=3364511 RepID=UPI00381EF319